MFKMILVPTDGSAMSDKAAEVAIRFAHHYGSRLIALSVAEPFPFSPFYESASANETAAYENLMQGRAFQYVQRIATTATEIGVDCQASVVQSFCPHEEIIKAVGYFKCDAVFMASHGRTGLKGLLLGSETQKVLAHSSIPVLVVR